MAFGSILSILLEFMNNQPVAGLSRKYFREMDSLT
jgi:hypothetical protein